MMFPTKNMMDYVNEMHRLFPKSRESYEPSTPRFGSSIYQTVMANKSSSSAESTSPESYSDFQLNQQTELFSFSPRSELTSQNITPTKRVYEQPSTLDYRAPVFKPSHTLNEMPHTSYELYGSHNVSRTLFDTPYPIRQQRAILGNSQLYKSDTKTIEKDLDLFPWHFEDIGQSSPDNVQKNYELFPVEKNCTNFSPIRRNSFLSSQNNTSPNSVGHSQSPSNISVVSQRFTPKSPLNPGFNTPHNSNYSTYSATGSKSEIGPSKMCTFCRKNGETPMVYTTHCVKERMGDRHIVTCPILRSHVCHSCGATGDDAHTISYCPILRSANNGKPLQSTTISLKNTRIKSSGKRRY